MSYLDFSNWSSDQLKAFAIIASMLLLVGGLTFLLRELGTPKSTVKSKKKKGRFGFNISQGEIVNMKVLQISQISPTIKNFILKPLDGYVDYQPGQFLSFHTGEDGKIIRCYSLNSSPSRPGMYQVSVKKLEGGQGSTWMHEQVNVGQTLKVTNPSGRFFFRQDAPGSVFVAGGIGITAMVAMLKYAIDNGDNRPLFFFYAAQTIDELVFHDELKDLASRSPNAHYIPILGQPPQGWDGKTGLISADMMLKAGVDFVTTDLYTCGPPPMMNAVKQIALDNGMSADRFYNEVFTSPASQKMEKKKCQVNLNASNIVLDYNDNIPLLEFFEKNNIDVPFSCRSGVCGTCEIKVNKGKTHQLPSEYLSDEDMATGARLSCICYPLEDIEVDL